MLTVLESYGNEFQTGNLMYHVSCYLICKVIFSRIHRASLLTSLKVCPLVLLSVGSIRALTFDKLWIKTITQSVAGNVKLDHCINVDIQDYMYLAISNGRPRLCSTYPVKRFVKNRSTLSILTTRNLR